MNLGSSGWNEQRWERVFREHAPEGCRPARVIAEHKGKYRVATETGEGWGEVAGRLHQSARRSELPATGDFVAVRLPDGDGPAIIHAVLPRTTVFRRKAAGSKVEDQVVAANVDTVFIVAGLDGELNDRRLERYLTIAWDSGAQPVVLLNKMDACADSAARAREIELIAVGAPVHPISAQGGVGLEALGAYLAPGQTVAAIGSSGVGKSTLINRLLGHEAQSTQPVRTFDSRGRHTTTHRELFLLPGGALIIDTPGMREIQLWTADEGLDATFADVEALAGACRFRDCAHDTEQGCAVRDALGRGELPPERLASFHKLARELRHVAAQTDSAAARRRKSADKVANRAMKAFKPR
ncbi:MAG TPA: ribosome small subunit-dependent GTPase A [Polyangia bacterium]|nr:ribosome small subunit-dependent GTPase A [Polyangia bacterium]